MKDPLLPHCFSVFVCAVACLSLPRQSHGQGGVPPVTLSKSLFQPQPVLLAPNNLTGSLYFEDMYSLQSTGSKNLTSVASANLTIAANSTVLFAGFTYVSCVSMQLSAPNSAVYAFVTSAYVGQFTASSGGQDYSLSSYSDSSSDGFLASALPINGTMSRLLADGPNATSASGAVATSTRLYDLVSLVLVNPTSSNFSITLEVGMSPLGPCQNCSTQRNSDGLLGNCAAALSNATFIDFDDKPRPAAQVKEFLQPIRVVRRDVDQGTSSVFAVFTNAACVMYTLKNADATSNLNLDALLSAWVVDSAQQQMIVNSGVVSPAQRQMMGCNYPATVDVSQPCFSFTSALDPNETYYVWVENVNGGSSSALGNVSVEFEVMLLRDTSNCSQSRLFDLSLSAQSLRSPPATSSTHPPPPRRAPPPAQLAWKKSPYDPGVTPFDFSPGFDNSDYEFPVMGVGDDGSLSQVGVWNITFKQGNASYVAQTFLANTSSFKLNMSQSIFPGLPFSNAGCFHESLRASQIVTSYLLPRSVLISKMNNSYYAPPNMRFSPNAYMSSVQGSLEYRTMTADNTTFDLLLNETYSLVVERPPYNDTSVSVTAVAYPPGSSNCQRRGAAPPPAAVQSLANSGAVRGIFDSYVQNNFRYGGSTNVAAITGAACIAFVASARGLSDYESGPPQGSQFYNVSSPGNSTSPDLSASAFLVPGRTLNQQFVLNGFIDPASPKQSPTPLTFTTGCLVNYTNPGPCMAYADNLNSSDFYFLWAASGAYTPEIWLFISFEARPSGSCKDAYQLTSSSAAPAPSPVLTPTPSSSATPIAAIVVPVVGGLAVVAAAIIFLVFLRNKRRKRLLNDTVTSVNISKVNETGDYLGYKEALRHDGGMMDLGGGSFASRGLGNDGSYSSPLLENDGSVPSPFLENDSTTEPSSASNVTGTGTGSTSGTATDGAAATDPYPGPAEIVASFAAAADSQSRTATGSRTIDSTHPGTGTPRPQVLELIDQLDSKLSDLKLKIVNGRPLKLGEGGFGAVYLGFLGVREVAVKIAIETSPAQQESFMHEILVLRRCRDPNIVLFLGASVGEEIVLVMEYMRGGNLFQTIRKDRDGRFRWRTGGAKLALDIAEGLYHLHRNSIVHRDLKSPNILLTEDRKQAKISDVGLAKFTTYVGTCLRPGNGLSFPWASPEQFLSGKVTAASDIFSFGVILWEICTGEAPSFKRGYRAIRIPEECPQAVADLIAQCMHSDASQRPTAQEAHRVLSKCVRSQSRTNL